MGAAELALLFASVTTQLSLPPGLLSAICFMESSHRTHVVNEFDGGSPSIGLCQIKLNTAKMVGFTGTAEELKDPSANAYWAGKYLKKQLDRYEWSYYKAVAAYNAGRFIASKSGNAVNKHYVNKVFFIWKGQP